jgi:hypothetical protein
MKTEKPHFAPAKSRYLRRRRILKGARDIERGLKDTERRGVPNDVPSEANHRRRRV